MKRVSQKKISGYEMGFLLINGHFFLYIHLYVWLNLLWNLLVLWSRTPLAHLTELVTMTVSVCQANCSFPKHNTHCRGTIATHFPVKSEHRNIWDWLLSWILNQSWPEYDSNIQPFSYSPQGKMSIAHFKSYKIEF